MGVASLKSVATFFEAQSPDSNSTVHLRKLFIDLKTSVGFVSGPFKEHWYLELGVSSTMG